MPTLQEGPCATPGSFPSSETTQDAGPKQLRSLGPAFLGPPCAVDVPCALTVSCPTPGRTGDIGPLMPRGLHNPPAKCTSVLSRETVVVTVTAMCSIVCVAFPNAHGAPGA